MMKRSLLSFLLLPAFCCPAAAQSALNVNMGQVTYSYAAENLGNVAVSGSSITVKGTVYDTADITSIESPTAAVEDKNVNVVNYGSSASVVIAGNLAGTVSATVRGAHVTLLQAAGAVDEITYTLGGNSSDGSLYMDGSLKATFVFNGLTLHNPDSAAVNIHDGKRIAIQLASGTVNTLSDGLAGADDGTDAHKACLYVQGHSEFSGDGTLTVTGNVKHGITSHEYCQIKKSAGTITVSSATGDGLHVGQYYEQRGGTVTVSSSSGDGIDVSSTSDADDEYNGQIILSGGTLAVTVSGAASDAMKCDNDFTMTGGDIILSASGDGGRAVNVNGSASLSGGSIEGVTTGGIYAEDTDNERKPHAMATDGKLTVSGGEVYFASLKNKSFKIDNLFLINGGTLMGIGAKSVTPSASGTQGYKTYTSVKVAAGATVAYDNVSFTVPAAFALNSAHVLVSRQGL